MQTRRKYVIDIEKNVCVQRVCYFVEYRYI